jgi:hypothetical protein
LAQAFQGIGPAKSSLFVVGLLPQRRPDRGSARPVPSPAAGAVPLRSAHLRRDDRRRGGRKGAAAQSGHWRRAGPAPTRRGTHPGPSDRQAGTRHPIGARRSILRGSGSNAAALLVAATPETRETTRLSAPDRWRRLAFQGGTARTSFGLLPMTPTPPTCCD